MRLVDCCPCLGLLKDSQTHCLTPDVDHRCYRFGKPTKLTMGHQAEFCIGPNHVRCPLSQDVGKGPPPRTAIVVALLAAVLASMAISSVMVLQTGSDQRYGLPWTSPAVGASDLDARDHSEVVSPTEVATAEAEPTPSETPTEVPATSTPPPTATMVRTDQVTPTATPASAVPTPAYGEPTPTPEAKVRVHVVVRGETVVIIAHRYGSTVAAIAEANHLADITQIRPGQTLLVPVGE